MTTKPGAPPSTGDLHQFASSPGDRFWGANDLFAFDAADAPAAAAFGYDPAFDAAGPFEPAGPFELPPRALAAPASPSDADLAHLFTHLALPPHGPDARTATSPQPPPPPPSAAPSIGGPLAVSPLSPDAQHSQNPHYYFLAQQHKAPPSHAAPPALAPTHRGYPPAPPPPHHQSYPPPPGSGPVQGLASGMGPVPKRLQQDANGLPPGIGPVPNRLKQDPNEEITTVFLAGFPDDITEREFANFFVFARGFEAASLKFPALPNQSQEDPYFALGGTAGPMLAGASGGSGSAASGSGSGSGPGSGPGPGPGSGPGSVPGSGPAGGPAGAGGGSGGPRSRTEQIIGFAKFRTRAEAMSARDYLNGRLIDAERGCVLKTEMAKKNLHTKSSRPIPAIGPGPMSPTGPGPGPGPSGVGPGSGLGPGHHAGHHAGHHLSLSHPHPHALHHHLPRSAVERSQFLAAADLRSAGFGMGSLGALPPPGLPSPLSPSAGGINSLGEAGSYASGNFGLGPAGAAGLAHIGPLSPPPLPLSPGPGSPLGLGPLPLSSSLSLPGSAASSSAHTSIPPPGIAAQTISSRSTSPSASGGGSGGPKGVSSSRVTSPLLRNPGAELDIVPGPRPAVGPGPGPGPAQTVTAAPQTQTKLTSASRHWSPPARSPPSSTAPQGYSDP